MNIENMNKCIKLLWDNHNNKKFIFDMGDWIDEYEVSIDDEIKSEEDLEYQFKVEHDFCGTAACLAGAIVLNRLLPNIDYNLAIDDYDKCLVVNGPFDTDTKKSVSWCKDDYDANDTDSIVYRLSTWLDISYEECEQICNIGSTSTMLYDYSNVTELTEIDVIKGLIAFVNNKTKNVGYYSGSNISDTEMAHYIENIDHEVETMSLR